MASDDVPAAPAPEVFLCGDDLVAAECADTRSAQALADHLRESGEWIECVAGIASCVAQFDLASVTAEQAGRRLVAAMQTVPAARDADAELIEVPVCYGGDRGPDLDDVCRLLGMDRAAFIERHTSGEYRVDMLGFTPGFAFIGGLDDRLRVPRRKEPRQRVAAGSVGIADGRTGLYAMASPGGWTLVGRTPMALFDAHADEPFLLAAGMRVRFHAVAADAFDA